MPASKIAIDDLGLVVSSDKPNLHELALETARDKGAVSPVWGHNSSGEPTIVDIDSGDCYLVQIVIRKLR